MDVEPRAAPDPSGRAGQNLGVTARRIRSRVRIRSFSPTYPSTDAVCAQYSRSAATAVTASRLACSAVKSPSASMRLLIAVHPHASLSWCRRRAEPGCLLPGTVASVYRQPVPSIAGGGARVVHATSHMRVLPTGGARYQLAASPAIGRQRCGDPVRRGERPVIDISTLECDCEPCSTRRNWRAQVTTSAAGTVKIAIVGAGHVGVTLAYACMIRGTGKTIALYDRNASKVQAEMLDLQHRLQFVPMASVAGSDDIEVCRDADVLVLTVGGYPKAGQPRLELARDSVAICRDLLPPLLDVGPGAVVVIVTNPVDVVTYAALKILGLPRNQVLGTGTLLDSSRLRSLISRRCGVAVQSVHAYIVGEHGDSEIR